MPKIVNHRVLKSILWLDAATGVAVAALQFTLPQQLSVWLGLDVSLLVGSAAVLLGYVALLLVVAGSSLIRSQSLQVLIWGNVGWGLGCIGLAVVLIGVTGLGIAYLMVQTVTVFAFAALQWRWGLQAARQSTSMQAA